jgi:hypothetical protein
MKRTLGNLLVNLVILAIILVTLYLAYLVFIDPMGHWFLCDSPGSKPCL